MPTLSWLTREKDVKRADAVAYRLLERDAALSVGDAATGNMLIQGDNLEALKSLLPYYRGQVKCIYIDPPYNTRSAFEHYDDNLEHSQWLAMIWPRLVLLRELLADDGVFMMSLNDDEVHYAKVICDEIFGRRAFVSEIIWNYEGNTDNQARIINYHEHIVVYSPAGDVPPPNVFDPNIEESSKLFLPEIRNTIVKNGPKNPISDIVLPKGFPCSFENGGFGKRGSEWPNYGSNVEAVDFKLSSTVTARSGWSSKKICESFIKNGFEPVRDSKGQLTRFELTKSGAIEAVKVREQEKGHFLSVLRGLGTTNQMRLLLDEIGIKFTFPKPVGLISYLVRAFSKDRDLVLDSFAGSGTTGHAVFEANALDGGNRHFILIEHKIETAEQIAQPRLAAVIGGNLNVGADVKGGDFAFYRLGEAVFDADGAINPGIAFAPLAAHVWFSETGVPMSGAAASPFLGSHDGKGLALLYNGILGDKRVSGGNVLTRKTLATVRTAAGDFVGPVTIYGEASRLSAESLKAEGVTFKQTPYDVKAR